MTLGEFLAILRPPPCPKSPSAPHVGSSGTADRRPDVTPFPGWQGNAPGPDQPRFLKLYAEQVLPRLRNMGVVVEDERPYVISPTGSDARWIKSFRLLYSPPSEFDRATLQRTFEDAYLAIARGQAEDDGFNRLVLAAGLAWREVALLRRSCV